MGRSFSFPAASAPVARPASFWNRALAILPALVFLAASWFASAHRGPFWLGPNADPSYVYLFSGLTLASSAPPSHADHPGGTVQRLSQLALGASGAAGDPGLARTPDALLHPEAALERMALCLSLVSAGLILAGSSVLAARGISKLDLLLVGLTPWASSALFSELALVKPEPLLFGLVFAYGAIWFASLRSPRPLDPIALGLLAGLALATKWLALLALPLVLVLPGVRRRWLAYSAALLGSFLLFTFHLGDRLADSAGFLFRTALRAGRYGSGSVGPPSIEIWTSNLDRLFRFDPALAVLVGATAAVALADLVRRRHQGRAPEMALAAVLALGLVLVAKQYEPRYLVPLSALSGLALALLRERLPVPAGRLAVGACALAALVIAAVVVLPAQRAVFGRWSALGATAGDVERLVEETGNLDCTLLQYGASKVEYALWLGNHQADRRFVRELSTRPGRVLNFWDERIESIGGEELSPPIDDCPAVRLRGRVPRDPRRRSGLLKTLQRYDLVDANVTALGLPLSSCRGECLLTVLRDGRLEPIRHPQGRTAR